MKAYRSVFSVPGIVPLAISSVLARMQVGMAAIGLVLYFQHETGSFATAGIATAAYTVGIGLTAPFLGRLGDRHGRVVLGPAALLSSLAQVAIVVLGSADAANGFLIAAAGFTGLATPPLGGVFRHRLGEMVSREDAPTAFAVDSILIETLFVTGPLLAGLLAATVGPGPTLVVAAILGFAGTAWFALLLPRHRHDPAARKDRPRLGALASPTVRFIVLSGVPTGAFFGALDVALPAFGVAHGSAALGGPFGAALALGSGVGGVAYGARPRALGYPGVAFMRLTFLQLLLALPLLSGPPVPLMFVFAAIAGCCVAPLISVRSEIMRGALPAGTGTEGFAWVSVSITLGASAGSALAGPLVEAGGWRLGVVVACAAPVLGALGAVARRHLL